MSECYGFILPKLWHQETPGCLDEFLHHYVSHCLCLCCSLLIFVLFFAYFSANTYIALQGAVYPLFTCLPSKEL